MMHLPHRISGEIAAHLKIAATVTFLQLGILEVSAKRQSNGWTDGRRMSLLCKKRTTNLVFVKGVRIRF